jgi:hypothetical protein
MEAIDHPACIVLQRIYYACINFGFEGLKLILIVVPVFEFQYIYIYKYMYV